MQRLKFYLGLLTGTALTLFALQNLQTIPVQLLLWHTELPLVVIVLGSALIGAIWASLWIALVRWRGARAESDTVEPPPPPATPGL